MQIIERIGVEAIESHIRELTEHLIAGALQIGCNVITPLKPSQRAALVTIRVERCACAGWAAAPALQGGQLLLQRVRVGLVPRPYSYPARSPPMPSWA